MELFDMPPGYDQITSGDILFHSQPSRIIDIDAL